MFKILLLFLSIRPILDLFWAYKLLGINVAGLYSVIIVALTLLNMFAASKKILKNNLKSVVTVGFIVMMMCSIPSVLISDYKGDCFTEILKYLILICVGYLLTVYGKYEKKRKKLIKAILVSFVLTSAYSVIQVLTRTTMWDTQVGGYRLYSTFTHPNQFAFYLVSIITMILLLRQEQYFQKKRTWMLFLLCAFVQLAMTYCRSAWVWIAFVIIGFILASNLKRKFLYVGLVGITGIGASDFVISRFADFLDPSKRSSMNARYRIWENMMSLVEGKNTFGLGVGTFERYNIMHFGSDLPSHNEYVHYYVETGIIGVIGLVVFFILLLYGSWQIEKKYKWIVVFFVLGLAVASYTSNIFSMLVSQIYFVSIFTLIQPIFIRRGSINTITINKNTSRAQ